MHSSLLLPPALDTPPQGYYGIQTLTLSRGSLYSLEVTEGQSVNNRFIVVMEYQVGIEKKVARELLIE